MFSQFLSILTCLAMLWHSFGGCCWHHDHRDCESGPVGGTAEVCQHDHAAHDHHSKQQQQHESEKPAPAPSPHGNHCEAGTCVYLKSFTPDPTDLFTSGAGFVTPVNESLNLQASSTLQSVAGVVLLAEDLSAQRRCALRQSWLL